MATSIAPLIMGRKAASFLGPKNGPKIGPPNIIKNGTTNQENLATNSKHALRGRGGPPRTLRITGVSSKTVQITQRAFKRNVWLETETGYRHVRPLEKWRTQRFATAYQKYGPENSPKFGTAKLTIWKDGAATNP